MLILLKMYHYEINFVYDDEYLGQKYITPISFMKLFTYIFTILISWLTIDAAAQTEWKKEACTCMETLNVVQDDLEEVQVGIDSCLKSVMLEDFTLFLKEEGIDMDNEETFQAAGMRIGQELFMTCEVYRFYAVRLAQTELELIEEEHEPYIVTGRLVKLKQKGKYSMFLVDTPAGRENFLWLRDFRGSSRFFEGLGEWKNKTVEIGWEQTALFDSQQKVYVYHKEIRWLDIID